MSREIARLRVLMMWHPPPYLALTKVQKAMAKHEAIRTSDEIEEEDRQRQRMAVIREFVESTAKKAVKPGRN